MRWLAIVMVGVLSAPSVVAAAPLTEVHYVMGTYFRITAEHVDESEARVALRRCFATARRFDELFSRFDPRSELSRINAAPDERRPVSIEMASLVRRALELQHATDGRFAVSVGSLSDLWRTSTAWPAQARIDTARRAAGEGSLALHDHVLVRRAGAQIDVDGIAKGWTVDHCVALLRAAGVARAFLSFGESSLYALGAPAGEGGWSVVVRGLNPDNGVGTLKLRDQAVSISAVFGHERRIGRTRVGHIIDPRSGLPLTSPAIAVVVTASATDAEAFSKALLIRDAECSRRGDTGRAPRTWAEVVSDVSRTETAVHPEVLEGCREKIRAVTGALLIRSDGVQRIGGIEFTPFAAAQPIAAAAEPLR